MRKILPIIISIVLFAINISAQDCYKLDKFMSQGGNVSFIINRDGYVIINYLGEGAETDIEPDQIENIEYGEQTMASPDIITGNSGKLVFYFTTRSDTLEFQFLTLSQSESESSVVFCTHGGITMQSLDESSFQAIEEIFDLVRNNSFQK